MRIPNFVASNLRPLPSKPAPIVGATRIATAGVSPTNTHFKKVLSVTHQPQQQSNWCWAAITAVVHQFYSNQVLQQCDIATQELQTNCCGASSVSSACNRFWYLDRALDRFGHFRSISKGPSPFQQALSEIQSNLVIGVRIEWPSGVGHFILVHGVDYDPLAIPEVMFLEVTDPLTGTGPEDYKSLVGGTYKASNGIWTHSYWTK